MYQNINENSGYIETSKMLFKKVKYGSKINSLFAVIFSKTILEI